jgi:3-phenylpropionate/trans-cinnamate dioxygenase ferredoxin subunit
MHYIQFREIDQRSAKPKEYGSYTIAERKMDFVKVAQTTEIASGNMKKVTCRGHEILLINIADLFYALSEACPHRGGRLSEGNLHGAVLTCPKHGARFDVKTGEAVGKAKMLFIKTKVKEIRSYPVKIIGDDILIGME